MRVHGIAACLIAATLASPAFAQGTPGVTNDTIRIGYLLPMSGKFESFGRPNQQVFLNEIRKINEAGGVKGRKIEVITEDDQCSPDQGVRGARKLIERGDVFMHFGYVCSGVAAAVRQIAGGTDLPIVVSSASGPDPKRNDENIFYITASTSRQGRALAAFAAAKLNAKRIALFRSSDAYGELSRGAIADYVKGNGLELVADEVTDNDVTDISAQITRIQRAKPDVVILATYANIAALYLAGAHNKGLDVPALGMAATEQAIDLVADPSFLSKFYSLTVFGDVFSGPKLAPYVDELKKVHPEWANKPIPQFTFLGLTESGLLVEALNRIEGPITRQAMIKTLASMKNWMPKSPTLACPLDFTRPHNEGSTCASIFKVGDKRMRIVIGQVDGL
jgi:branched-chain amino acid transport system substrate-binding protein